MGYPRGNQCTWRIDCLISWGSMGKTSAVDIFFYPVSNSVAFDPSFRFGWRVHNCPLSLWKCCSFYIFSMRIDVNPSCLWNQTTENKHIKFTSNGLPCRHIGVYLVLSWKKLGQFEASSWVTWYINLGKFGGILQAMSIWKGTSKHEFDWGSRVDGRWLWDTSAAGQCWPFCI